MKNIFKKIIYAIITTEAKMALAIHQPKIVAITGSVGKTSTKEAIYTVLSAKYKTWKSQKSFNSEIGVPLTILGLNTGWDNPWIWISNILKGLGVALFSLKYPEWIVLEVGADHPGDIEKITKWLTPDITVITQMSDVPVHIEFFNSLEDVIKEKAFLAKALRNQGVLVLNNDDRTMNHFRKATDSKVISFGFEKGASVVGSKAFFMYKDGKPIGISFRADYSGNSVPIRMIGSLGKQHIYPVLAAISVGIVVGLNIVEIAEIIKKHITPVGRMYLLDGIKNSIIIDDTYNSSPIAVERALETLKDLEVTGRKIVVLGDMRELGEHTEKMHKKIGNLVGKFADIFVAVGEYRRFFVEGASDAGLNSGRIFEYKDSDSAKNEIERMIEPGDILLIKGSQSARMEKIVEEIMANPESKDLFLVRQEKEWKNK